VETPATLLIISGDSTRPKINTSDRKKLKKKTTANLRKESLDTALMQKIDKDIEPFSFVDDEGCRNFVKVLDSHYTLPSRTNLQNVQM